MHSSNQSVRGGAGSRSRVVDMVQLPDPTDPTQNTVTPSLEEINQVKNAVTRHLKQLQHYQEQMNGKDDTTNETDLLQMVHTCQQVGLTPLPDDIAEEKEEEAKRLYKYINEKGKPCVAPEFVQNQPRKKTKAQVLDNVLDMVKEFHKKHNKEVWARTNESKEGEDGNNDDEQNGEQEFDMEDYQNEADGSLAFKHCVSKTSADQCGADECEAFVIEDEAKRNTYKSKGEGQDFTTNVREENLPPVDETTPPEQPVACVPGPRLHLKKMERIRKILKVYNNSLRTVRSDIKKLTHGMRQEEISALQSFVLPSFHARETESAEQVLQEKRESVTKLEKAIRHFQLLFNKYAEIAADLNMKHLKTKTTDEICQKAETKNQCKAYADCELYDVSPVNIWSVNKDKDDMDSALIKPNDPYAKYIGSQQCRFEGALTRRKPNDKQVDDLLAIPISGGAELRESVEGEEETEDMFEDWHAPATHEGGDGNDDDDNESNTNFVVLDTKPYDFDKLSAELMHIAYGNGDLNNKIRANKEYIYTITQQMKKLFKCIFNYELFQRAAHRKNPYDLKTHKFEDNKNPFIKLEYIHWKSKENTSEDISENEAKEEKENDGKEDTEHKGLQELITFGGGANEQNIETAILHFLRQSRVLDTKQFEQKVDYLKLNREYKTRLDDICEKTSKKIAMDMFKHLYTILKLAKDIHENMESATKSRQDWQLWMFFERYARALFTGLESSNVEFLNYILSSPFKKLDIEEDETSKSKCEKLDFYENVLRSMYRPSFVGQHVLVNPKIIKESGDGAKFWNEVKNTNRDRNMPLETYDYRKGYVIQTKIIKILKKVNVYPSVPKFVAFPRLADPNEYWVCELDINDNQIETYGLNVISSCPNPTKKVTSKVISKPYYMPTKKRKDIYKGSITHETGGLDELKEDLGINEGNEPLPYPTYQLIEKMYEKFKRLDDEEKKKISMRIGKYRMRKATNANEFLNKKGKFTVLVAGATSVETDYITPDMNILSLNVTNPSAHPAPQKTTSIYDRATTIEMERV